MSGERIRVLRVIARLNMGGPTLHVSYLSKGLDERGYETTLVAGRLARGEDSMAFAAEELGVEVVPILQLHRDLSPMYDAVSVKRLVREIHRVRPHIVHTHTAKAGAVGRMAALLAGDAKPPVVVHTFHGHVLRGYFDPMRTEFFRETEKFLAKHTTRLIAVGPEVRDDLVELGVAPAEKFSVIRLGIDLEGRLGDRSAGESLRRQFGIPKGRFVVGWIGRMTGIKRVPDVLAAFKRLVDEGVDAQLVLVGDGPERGALEGRARELRIQKRTLFAGYQRDVSAYYDLFDALLLPSANEGTPVVAIESLAAGIPVVATRVGGVPDVVRDGIDGFLTGVGEIDAMGRRLAELANDRELAARMGAAGREHVVPRYRVSRLVDDVDAQLVLVGDGPERGALERRARELRIQKRTLFAGYQRDVSAYYDLFDALLLPSANEGTPVVAIESLAAGIPVVATRVGGVPDVVRDGIDGFLTGVGEIDAMGKRLAELANDRELAARMGAAGREHVVPRYRVSRLVDDVDALYRELLADAGLALPRAA